MITIYPEGAIDVCTKFHGNPSNICLDISLKTTNVNLMAVLEKKSGDHQSH